MEFKFKKGDKIKCIDSIIGCSEGKIYTLIKDSHWIEFKDDDGSLRARSIDGFELVKDTPKPKFKIGDRVRIKNKITQWASRLSNECPLDLSYPKEFVIEEIKQCENYTAMRASGYGFDLSALIDKNNIELVEEGCNSCEVNSDNVGEMLGRAKRYLEWGNGNRGLIGELERYEYYNNEPSNSSGNKVGKIMSKVSEFVKNSLLSKEEKLLRKYGLKDSCGDYTDEAERLVTSKLIKENEAYLVEVATALEAEEKASK